jgi:hypothetical protein
VSVHPIRPDVMAAIMRDPEAVGQGPFVPLAGHGYRLGEVVRCPGCANTHWLVGRSTAECAFCATALPLV